MVIKKKKKKKLLQGLKEGTFHKSGLSAEGQGTFISATGTVDLNRFESHSTPADAFPFCIALLWSGTQCSHSTQFLMLCCYVACECGVSTASVAAFTTPSATARHANVTLTPLIWMHAKPVGCPWELFSWPYLCKSMSYERIVVFVDKNTRLRSLLFVDKNTRLRSVLFVDKNTRLRSVLFLDKNTRLKSVLFLDKKIHFRSVLLCS